jgi:hypothetical protein
MMTDEDWEMAAQHCVNDSLLETASDNKALTHEHVTYPNIRMLDDFDALIEYLANEISPERESDEGFRTPPEVVYLLATRDRSETVEP